MILTIDNYDSFTFNIVRYLAELGCEVIVKRNNEISLDEIERLAPSHIVISPGPHNPNKAGISLATINRFAGIIPIMGICLGHQSIVQAFGGTISTAPKVMHGKTSQITHTGTGCFTGLPSPFMATRYHSLVAKSSSIPDCLEVTAWTTLADSTMDIVMGVKHRTLPIHGVQFHPESILTEHGHQLLRNFTA